jgi:hypothetical protein
MTGITAAGLTYQGESMDASPQALGELRRSDDVVEDRSELHRRMRADGYLFLPGILDREEVLTAHRAVVERLAEAEILDESYPIEEGIVRADAQLSFMPALARDNAALDRVLYSGSMMAFYESFLGGAVRHFDYTWFRAKTPGTSTATQPHYDIVFMGRGTRDLYTSWTPLHDVPYEMGGLVVLEGSHKLPLRQSYGQTDVDRYCENEGDAKSIVSRAQEEQRELTSEERQSVHWNSTGHYSGDAIEARRELGDLLVFGMFTMHGSSDNHTDRIRLSSDSRYQLASEPVDERWIGDDPPMHGIRAKQGMIC